MLSNLRSMGYFVHIKSNGTVTSQTKTMGSSLKSCSVSAHSMTISPAFQAPRDGDPHPITRIRKRLYSQPQMYIHASCAENLHRHASSTGLRLGASLMARFSHFQSKCARNRPSRLHHHASEPIYIFIHPRLRTPSNPTESHSRAVAKLLHFPRPQLTHHPRDPQPRRQDPGRPMSPDRSLSLQYRL